MGGLGAPEIILIIIAILLLFGGKKIPELMRGLGKGVKEFKDAQNHDDVNERPSNTNTTASPRHEEKTNI
ncbi:twin-arginine translocase TatA/TatE family subunit [Mucilaginibacter ginkgonis]|uniref:Sec-independent protein translocase protein TatA n=1 Tax=Mucilaginibacter ginkgonis TaxID=2682091 RepID=A0A6I4HZC9_9SPHI|nr:twin-arginine translocase TatA/TatE family subunit [Mucilaginibacter ginkgonis]QQL48788.1 twin-arginine translocase TatA/TatE family subunit [Mucilaginibacter ginkgonis]